MNKVILMGRLVRDPELTKTPNNVSVCSFSLAVDRTFKNPATGEREADFINLVAWQQRAEFIAKYFRKGNRILIAGNLRTRSWMGDDGKKRYVTEVIVDEAEFVESKKSTTSDYADPVYEAKPSVTSTGVKPQEVVKPDVDFFDEPDDDTTLPFDL